MPIDVTLLAAASSTVLAVVLLVGWLRSRAARRPDRSMAQFRDALGALRPDDEQAGPDDEAADGPRDQVASGPRDA